jgi:TonB family protein
MSVDVMADTGRTVTLDVEPPRGAVWMSEVSERRREPAPSPPLDLPAPEPTPAPLPPALPPPPPFVVDAPLTPPELIESAPLRVPAGARRAWIELDVHVDEAGTVPEVAWAGGSRDPELLRAAIECAQSMRFRPASRGGRPAAVWCRQRFDFESRR